MGEDVPSGMPCIDMDEASDAAVVHGQVQDACCLLRLGDETATVELDLPARHWAMDMALAATAMRCLTHGNIGEIAHALAGWKAVPGRMQPLPGIHASTIIHDAYNANPASMSAALDTVGRMPGRHFAVLGDMAELGTASRTLHAALDVSGMDGLVLVGDRMRALVERCDAAQWAPDADTAIAMAKALTLRTGDVVLVKGSRCMGLEKVVDTLTENGSQKGAQTGVQTGVQRGAEAQVERKMREKADAV